MVKQILLYKVVRALSLVCVGRIQFLVASLDVARHAARLPQLRSGVAHIHVSWWVSASSFTVEIRGSLSTKKVYKIIKKGRSGVRCVCVREGE